LRRPGSTRPIRRFSIIFGPAHAGPKPLTHKALVAKTKIAAYEDEADFRLRMPIRRCSGLKLSQMNEANAIRQSARFDAALGSTSCFFAFATEVREMIYTTNAVDALHRVCAKS
jgi:hypothetical protein